MSLMIMTMNVRRILLDVMMTEKMRPTMERNGEKGHMVATDKKTLVLEQTVGV